MLNLTKFGFLIKKIDDSQLSREIFRLINTLSEQQNLDIILFREQLSVLPEQPKFALMNLHEVWGYDGICISTDISTTEVLLSSACPKNKYFYLWNLEWLYDSNVMFDRYKNIYMNKDIELITRSDSHHTAVNNAWKKPIFNWENFNVREFKTIFGI